MLGGPAMLSLAAGCPVSFRSRLDIETYLEEITGPVFHKKILLAILCSYADVTNMKEKDSRHRNESLQDCSPCHDCPSCLILASSHLGHWHVPYCGLQGRIHFSGTRRKKGAPDPYFSLA